MRRDSFVCSVQWDDGTSWTSTWVSPSSPVSKSHTYDFPYGTIPVSVQMEITSGSRTATTMDSVTVGGGSLVDSISHVPKASSATLTATLTDAVVQDGATEARIQYFDAPQNAWQSGPWTTVSDGSTFSWTPTGLNVEAVYEAGVEFQANNGASSWTSPGSWSFQANKRPTLTALETGARDASYLDDVRFSVLYQDREGDAPATINVTLNGQPYDMHASFGDSLDHASGVTYHYVARDGELPPPGSYWPTYQANDAYQGAQSVQGGRVTVKQAAVATHTFQGDTVSGTPQGFTKSSESLNYWRTADTDEPGFPALAALGGHGKAAWFGHPPGANYEDPDGGVPRGSLYTRTYDLSTLQDPVLSFSSYYETEDLGTTKDTKQVLVRSKDPQSTSWDTDWTPLHTIQGIDGGYKKWRSQAISLDAYKDQVVQLEFRFDAKDNQRNDYLGWLIDDIGIGHDHDGDTLPDELEEARWQVQKSNQIAPASFDDEWGHRSIRSVDRVDAESYVLTALVSHPSPEHLELNVGVVGEDATGTVTTVPLYDSSSAKTGCTSTLSEYFFFSGFGPQKPVVEQTSDGLKVRIDLLDCLEWRQSPAASSMDGSARYFIEVKDTRSASSAESGWIESLELYSSGRSDKLQEDSDGDDEPDGVEVDAGIDPSGHDHDRDGIHQSMDADDEVPNYIPSVDLYSDDYGESFLFEFGDELSVVPHISFTARTGATGDGQDLPYDTRPGSKYDVNTSWADSFPFTVTAEWTDAYGTRNVFDYEFDVVEGDVLPVALEVENRDASTEETSTLEFIINRDHPAQGYRLSHCIIDYYIPSDVKGWTGKGFNTLAVKTLKAGGQTAKRIVPLVQFADLVHWTQTSPTGIACSHPILFGTGANMYGNEETDAKLGYDDTDTQEFANQGVSESELVEAIRFGLPTRYDGEGKLSYRWIDTSNHFDYDEVVVLDNIGSGKAEHVADAWKWSLPGEPGVSGSWGVEDFLAVEQEIVQGVPDAGVAASTYSVLLNHADYDECEDDLTTIMGLQSASNGEDTFFPQTFEMGNCVLSALRESLDHDQFLNEWGQRQDRIDQTLSEAVWRHAKMEAEQGDSPPNLNWYYDNNDNPSAPPLDCASLSSGWDSDLRRCNEYQEEAYWSSWSTHKPSVDYPDYTYDICGPRHSGGTMNPSCPTLLASFILDNYLASREMDWISTNGRSDYQDLVAADSRLSSDRQKDVGLEFVGVDWVSGAMTRMDAQLAGVSAPGKDDEVRVAVDGISNEAWLDFRDR